MGVFIENKYYRWYIALTERAKGRVLGEDVYTEVHHVLPRSLGGSNDLDNLVNLTAREHFLAHLMLVKCLEGENQKKMIRAAFPMSYHKGKRINSRKSSILKEQFSKTQSSLMKNKPKSEEHKRKMSINTSGDKNPMWGKFGNLNPNYGNHKLAGKNHPMYGKTHSPATIQKIKEALKFSILRGKEHPMYGKSPSKETTEKNRQSNREKWKDINYRKLQTEIRKTEKYRLKYCKYEYELTDLAGKKYYADSISHFAKTHGLNAGALYAVLNKKRNHHKGFKVIKLGEIEHV